MTGQFAAVVLKHDDTAYAKLAVGIEAANENWQRELDNDPEYIEWIEEQARTEMARQGISYE